MSLTAVFTCATALGVQSGQQPSDGSSALGGPRVEMRNVPGSAEGMLPSNEIARRMTDRIPPPVFLEAVRSLDDPTLAPEVRATPELMTKLRGMGEAFRSQRESYMRANRDELRRLREQAGVGAAREARRGRGGAPESDPGMRDGADAQANRTPERQAALARLREIEAAAPKPETLYTQVWAQLSEAQRAHVDAKLEPFRAEQSKGRQDAYVRERLGERGGRAAGLQNPNAVGQGGRAQPVDAKALAERKDRLLRIFEQLPPDEQDRILRRLEARLEGTRSGPRTEGKPAPSSADLELPR